MIKKVFGNLLGYERELHSLRQKVKQARWDSVFSMHTREGLLDIAGSQPRTSRHTVVFLDLDRMHEHNLKLGYEEVNRRVRATFRGVPWRKSDVIARWFSGDEIVLILDSDEEGARHCLARLSESASREGLSFTAAHSPWTPARDSLPDLVLRLADRVLELKRSRNHTSQTARHTQAS